MLSKACRFALLMVAVSFVTFALVSASPVDPVQANMGQAAYARMSAEKRAELSEYWGKDEPLLERYVRWAGDALRGDLGESLRYNEPVVDVIAERAGNTLALMAVSWLLSGCLGFALGVFAGMRRGRLADRIISAVCYVLSATPAFSLGLVALMVFSVWLGWFPLGFSVPVGVDAAEVTVAERLYHMVLPALVLSVTSCPAVALHTRQKTVGVLQSDYVSFARERGESDLSIAVRHGLRNLAVPAITLQFSQIGEVFGGSVLVEQVFSYPGLGQAAVTAGVGGDAPLLVAIALASAALVFAGNACADALQAVIDPRVGFRGRSVVRGLSRLLNRRPARRSDSSPSHSGGTDLRGTGGVQPCRSAEPAGFQMQADGGPRAGFEASGAIVYHAVSGSRRGNRMRMLLSLALACVFVALVLAAGMRLSGAAQVTDFARSATGPSPAHPFGFDWMGRDVFVRTLAGLSTSIAIGAVATVASAIISFVLACVSVFGGRRGDALVCWLVDLALGIPHIVLLLLISYALGKGVVGVSVGVALTHWPSLTRVFRGELLQAVSEPYLENLRALGTPSARIALDHLLPALMPQLIAGMCLTFPHAILHEASITFLGFGLPPDAAAVGVILSESMSYLSAGMWWTALLPAAALVALVLALDHIGDLARRLLGARTVQE